MLRAPMQRRFYFLRKCFRLRDSRRVHACPIHPGQKRRQLRRVDPHDAGHNRWPFEAAAIEPLQKMTLLTVVPRLRTNNLKGLGATLTIDGSEISVLTGPERGRRWSEDERCRIVAEAFAPVRSRMFPRGYYESCTTGRLSSVRYVQRNRSWGQVEPSTRSGRSLVRTFRRFVHSAEPWMLM